MKTAPELAAEQREFDLPDLASGQIGSQRAGDSEEQPDIAELLPGRKIDAEILDELETRLITADVGVEATRQILEELRRRVARKELDDVAPDHPVLFHAGPAGMVNSAALKVSSSNVKSGGSCGADRCGW